MCGGNNEINYQLVNEMINQKINNNSTNRLIKLLMKQAVLKWNNQAIDE